MIVNYSNNIWENENVDEKFHKILINIHGIAIIDILILYGNGLKAKHIKKLSKILINQDLKILDLSYNHMNGASAMECISEIIQHNPSLQRIDLEYNDITDTDIIYLVNLVQQKQDHKLKKIELCLANNSITDTGLGLVFDKLSLSTIASIKFSCCLNTKKR